MLGSKRLMAIENVSLVSMLNDRDSDFIRSTKEILEYYKSQLNRISAHLKIEAKCVTWTSIEKTITGSEVFVTLVASVVPLDEEVARSTKTRSELTKTLTLKLPVKVFDNRNSYQLEEYLDKLINKESTASREYVEELQEITKKKVLH